ncbi:MAG: efflux RND transporter permease subunit [Bdellovibrionales bacterium]
MIANAIVIIESILERLDRGDSPVAAAVDGTKSVVVPVLAAGGTNLVVFTPIAFMGGIIGQFMLQFGMTVVYATIFSLIASFSLTPMLCALLLRPKNKNAIANPFVRVSEKFVNFLITEYRLFFDLIFRFPKSSVGIVIVLFVGAFTVAPYVGNEFIPVSDRDRLEVVLTLPLGTRVEESEQVAKQVEVLFKDMPEVISVLSILGQNGEQNASVIAILKPGDERKRSDTDLIEEITPQLALLPNAEVEIIRGDGGGRANGDVSINITGNDYDEMVLRAKDVMKVMRESGYFRSVTSSYKSPKEEMKFYPDASKIEKYGLSSALVGRIFRSSIYGDDTNIYRDNGEEFDIVVKVSDEFIHSAESMKDLFIISNTGLVPVTELGQFKMTDSVPTILRRDRQRVIQLNGFLAKSTAGVVQAELTTELEKLSFSDDVSYAFVGNAESQEESGREIMKAFMLAIILTYMILAAIMNSFVHPFTIATSIITSFSGVFLILFFLDFSINIASMLGFVMLVGLAVNNAILILEEVQVAFEKDSNISIQDALWYGIKMKFRAVLMTSIAIVFGALPQLWSPNLAKAAMGAVIVGGVLASIFFTFFLTPQTYFYLERMRRWFSGT